MMGAMKPMTRVHRLILIVLTMRGLNIGEAKNCLKYWKPTQSPPVRPLVKSYFLNAS